MSWHYSVRSRPGRLVFTRHGEAATLWRSLTSRLPELRALCLMPDHLHLLHAQDVTARLGAVLGGYAEWRNGQTGHRGSLWRHDEQPTEARGPKQARTVERYIHLNPCRARLTRCPLAWAWSTHRDRTGLVESPVRTPAHDPRSYHARISDDATAQSHGTPWPIAPDVLDASWSSLLTVQEAVSAVTRTTLDGLDRRGPSRTLLLRASLALTQAPPSLIADFTRVSARTIRRTPASWAPDLTRVARVLGDPRFSALDDADLRRQPLWSRYQGRS